MLSCFGNYAVYTQCLKKGAHAMVITNIFEKNQGILNQRQEAVLIS